MDGVTGPVIFWLIVTGAVASDTVEDVVVPTRDAVAAPVASTANEALVTEILSRPSSVLTEVTRLVGNEIV